MIFCSLYSGSSGNCTYISSHNTRILVDAGLPGKSIEKALKQIEVEPQSIDGIFVTHEHIDHIKGVGVLSRKYNLPIFANSLTWKSMIKTIGNIKEHNIKVIGDKYVNVKDMDILRYNIPHDAACPSGYAIYSEGKKVCIATDMGAFSDEVKTSIEDSDLILLESNHDVEMLKFGPYPYTLKRRILSNIGHLSNEDCGRAIVNITNGKRKTIVLGHLSKTNNYPELAYKTVVNILRTNKISLNQEVVLTMAKRDTPSSYIEL
jgi:phosphoribosyl 1,2-cyclic phosphodiesterase